MIIPLFPRTPTSAPEIHDPDAAASIRRLDCASYNACLSDAYERRWPGFACTSCRAYRPRSRDDLRADLIPIANMLHAVPGDARALRERRREREHNDAVQLHHRRSRA